MLKPFASLRRWAQRLKRDVVAVWFAARDPATPFAVRLLAAAVAAYALSPIDLIPDFIPVLGLLDDALIVPLGLWWVLRLLPADVLQRAREKATTVLERPRSRTAAVVIACLWLVMAAAAVAWFVRR